MKPYLQLISLIPQIFHASSFVGRRSTTFPPFHHRGKISPNSNNLKGSNILKRFSTISDENFNSNKSEDVTTLTNSEISRYSRHLVLSDVGMKGQLKLKNSKVLVVGAGGLGSPCLMYLAAAGVGHIGIVVRL